MRQKEVGKGGEKGVISGPNIHDFLYHVMIECTHEFVFSIFGWFHSTYPKYFFSSLGTLFLASELVSSSRVCIGSTTNNLVEYHVVIGLLTNASYNGVNHIIFYLDSKLVIS